MSRRGGWCTDDGELARRLGSLAQLARELGAVSTFETVLEVPAEFVRAGLRSSTVSLSRMQAGTGTLRTLLNVGARSCGIVGCGR